jgi:WD40 repeat protein
MGSGSRRTGLCLPCARRTTLRSSTPAAARGHDSWVYGVAFSPRGDLIATASWDQTARIWDAATGACLATLAGHAGTVEAVAFSPSGALLATVSSDATARLWDAASGAHLATLVPLPSGGYLTLLPDARYKLDGDPGDCLWWAAGLCRLTPAEVSSRFPEVRRLPPGTPILPA